MKFSEFKIANFKGIEDITFNLDKLTDSNIYTLVGLNESGKTTILEAINLFNPNDLTLNGLELPGTTIKNYNELIPISKRDNFNDTISIIVTLKLEESDYKDINEFVANETPFRKVKIKESITYYRYYRYKNSLYEKLDRRWDSFEGVLKTDDQENYINIHEKNYPKENVALSTFCRKLIPDILYFPNFLFDFPSRIYLKTKPESPSKDNFYIELVQDILNSLDNNTNIQTHLIDRIHSDDQDQRRNLDRQIQLMERKVTEVIFGAWARIFKRQIKDTKIVIKYNVDGDNMPFLEFGIESEDGIYQLNERSLGFKWFFIFLLFTQFRPFRKGTQQNIIFLFDEPASNLHPTAQQQLLKSFENLTDNSKVIYTTHSHHLINPDWLESTYVVKNEGLHIEDPETFNIKKTKIIIEPYRQFAANHPYNTAYFQPILDVLDYKPSNLEILPDCVLLEGKYDYYNLIYFQNIILKNNDKLCMSPSTGSGNMDTLISLYIGWGKEFIILLDSDKAGRKEKERYITKFGIIVEQRIFLLSDIDVKWENKSIEKVYVSNDALNLQQHCYPSSTDFNKIQFNRAVQECLINKKDFGFSAETVTNFSEILEFLTQKILILKK